MFSIGSVKLVEVICRISVIPDQHYGKVVGMFDPDKLNTSVYALTQCPYTVLRDVVSCGLWYGIVV